MKDFFLDFSATSRVWIYMADKQFPGMATVDLQPEFDAFAKSWTAHKQQLKAEIRLVHNYFIIVMVDEDYQQPSGCGIDASVHFMKEVGKKYGIDLFDRMRVSYIQDGVVENVPVNELLHKLHQREVDGNLVVFNTLVSCKEELMHNFTIPLKESWLKRYL